MNSRAKAAGRDPAVRGPASAAAIPWSTITTRAAMRPPRPPISGRIRTARTCSTPGATISAAAATTPTTSERQRAVPPGTALFVRLCARALHHHDLSPETDPAIKVGHVLVHHSDAAGGDVLADRVRLVGAMNAIERRAEIEGACAERIGRPALHMARQIGAAL